MERVRDIGSAIVVTAILVSAFWIFVLRYRIRRAARRARSTRRRRQGASSIPAGGRRWPSPKGSSSAPPGSPSRSSASSRANWSTPTLRPGPAAPASMTPSTSWRRSARRWSRRRRDGRETVLQQGGGGTTAYVRSDDKRWSYYYAHLSAYAPGLHEGQQLRRGAPVGYVGYSGNANPAGPHLHFAINRMSRARNGGRARRSIPIRCLPESPQAARGALF